MKRALLLPAAAALVAGCAAAHVKITRANQGLPPVQISVRVPSQAANRAAVQRDAERLLRHLRARLPQGARRIAWKRPSHDSPGFLQLHRAWRIARSPASVRRYLARHGLRDRRLAGHTGQIMWRWLLVSAKALPEGGTAVRALVVEEYVLPLPLHDRVPQTVRTIEVRSAWYTNREMIIPPPPIVATRVTGPSRVATIVQWFDRLGRVVPQIACILPARVGPTVTFTFRDASGHAVAHAIAGDTESSLTDCDAFQVAVGGRSTHVIGGDILRRVQRLLGVSFEPHPVRIARGTRCPTREPALHVVHGGRHRHTVVRPNATALLLCRYGGTATRPYPIRLTRSVLIRNRRTIGRFTRELNSLKRVPRGAYACPMDNGQRILLIFGYRTAAPERVEVSLSGCRFATSPWTNRWASPRLLHQLESLTASGRAGTS